MADDFLCGITEHLGGGLVERLDDSPRVDGDDAFAGRLEDGLQVRFALFQQLDGFGLCLGGGLKFLSAVHHTLFQSSRFYPLFADDNRHTAETQRAQSGKQPPRLV
ncbi:MAG: hypothetical protein ACE5KM_06200 [Planctomycetaceae bacterium]